MMKLEYRHNSFQDVVILIGLNDPDRTVRSDWPVTPAVLREFCDCSQDAADWEDRGGDEHTAEEYGNLIAVRRGYALDVVDADAWERRILHLLR